MLNNFIFKKKGMAPGTLVYEGDTEPRKTNVTCYELSPHGFNSVFIDDISKLPTIKSDKVFWLRVIGLANISFITEIGRAYDISHLTLEDILETSHRAKFEDNGSYMFTIMKQISYSQVESETTVGQISIALFNGLIVTFEEWETEEISSIVKRALHKPDTFFTKGAAYLEYAIIDSIVDNYLSELNNIEGDIEDLEDKMTESESPIDTDELFDLRRRVNTLHRTTRPTMEIVDKLSKSAYMAYSGDVVSDFFKDLTDHAIRVNDNIQNSKDAINAIYDENISRIQLAANGIFNILTIFSVVFLPPMVISGIYGMNFASMPLVDHKLGFYLSILLMVFSSGFLLIFFKIKKYF